MGINEAIHHGSVSFREKAYNQEHQSVNGYNLSCKQKITKSEVVTLMPIHPFTSRVVIVSEQELDRASRHLSVTPTIPNKLHYVFFFLMISVIENILRKMINRQKVTECL